MRSDISKVLFGEDEIKRRVEDLGRVLAKDYAGKEPLVLGTLTGAFIFTADLVRAMEPCPNGLEVVFCHASSYGSSTVSSGQVNISQGPQISLKGRDVIIVEDIVDTGHTLTRLIDFISKEGARSVECVVLLDKEARRIPPVNAKYTGFKCPDEFVVGYGMDYDQNYRSLPYIGILHPHVYEDKRPDFHERNHEKAAQAV